MTPIRWETRGNDVFLPSGGLEEFASKNVSLWPDLFFLAAEEKTKQNPGCIRSVQLRTESRLFKSCEKRNYILSNVTLHVVLIQWGCFLDLLQTHF